MSRPPKFLADIMLGSLARWLRILGYDTAYDNTIEDEELVRRCIAEGRVALTRDTRLARDRRLPCCLLIESNELEGQLQEVLAFTEEPVMGNRLLSRCLECNHPLEPVSAETIRDRVPPYVFQTQRRFHQCPACQRVYWGGTHREQILRRLQALQEARRL